MPSTVDFLCVEYVVLKNFIYTQTLVAILCTLYRFFFSSSKLQLFSGKIIQAEIKYFILVYKSKIVFFSDKAPPEI